MRTNAIPNKRKTPQLRVVVTPQCNLRCIYCKPGGEGYYKNLHIIHSKEEIITIIQLATIVGFTHVKFTGGEPLLRKDLFDIIEETRTILGIKEIQMVTNGTLLKGKAAELKKAGIDYLTLSMDAVDPIIFKEVRRTDILPVLEGLYECKEVSLPVRINMVVMKSNLSQIEPMINLCRITDASLKLLDLIYMDGYSNFDFWRREYVHFDVVRDLLCKWNGKYVGLEEAPGGIGAPLEEYRMQNGVQVVLNDSSRGTFYHNTCEECGFYPCQDAVISVRVTHDGQLKRCLIRNDNLVPLLQMLQNSDITGCINLIQKVFTFMTESKYYPHKWSPEVLINQKIGDEQNE